MASVIFQEQLEVPGGIDSLAEFRRWATSDRFPERGRIDYVSGCIEVDMQPMPLSSVGKDTKRLPAAYFNAGVREFWLIDARGDDLIFHIHRRGSSSFEPVDIEDEDRQQSTVFSRRFRLTRNRNRHGRWIYDLETC